VVYFYIFWVLVLYQTGVFYEGFFPTLVFAFVLAVLGFELRASCLLGRCSITWTMPPAFFLGGLVIFQIEPHTFCPGPASIYDPSTKCVLSSWDCRLAPPHPSLYSLSSIFHRPKRSIFFGSGIEPRALHRLAKHSTPQKGFTFNEVQSVIFLVLYLNHHSQTQGQLDFLISYLLGCLQFCILHLGLYLRLLSRKKYKSLAK
jgi:hypothetical protein